MLVTSRLSVVAAAAAVARAAAAAETRSALIKLASRLSLSSPNWNPAEAGVSASIPEDAGPRLQQESLASD